APAPRPSTAQTMLPPSIVPHTPAAATSTASATATGLPHRTTKCRVGYSFTGSGVLKRDARSWLGQLANLRQGLGRGSKGVGENFLHLFARSRHQWQVEALGFRHKFGVAQHVLERGAQQFQACRWDIGSSEKRAADFVITDEIFEDLQHLRVLGELEQGRYI